MRLLLKFPTRSRPQQALKTLQAYCNMATRPDRIGIALSCDEDDDSMTRSLVQEEFTRIMGNAEWSRVFYGNNKTKIEACNADMSEITYPWDIVMLVSDDMVPIIKGYDDAIRSHMMASFPDTNGILWFNDGHQGNALNTLSIMGRVMYNQFGYIYQPTYKSFYCDTEFTDLCKTTLADKCLYVPTCIVRHEHPGHGYGGYDALYVKNQMTWTDDMTTYINRKAYSYDWTILIATIPGRENSLQSLLKFIHETSRAVCPDLRVKVAIGFDACVLSIGAKRQQMLQAAEGKYVSFIDDDDRVTREYFEDASACIRGGFDCCRLRGKISSWTFTHSIANKLDQPMANETTFLRPPNHLNVMKADIAKTVAFTDALYGEDLDWTIRLARTGYIRTEYQPDEERIHYIYEMRDRALSSAILERQRNTTHEQMLASVLVTRGSAPPPPDTPSTLQLRLGARGFTRT